MRPTTPTPTITLAIAWRVGAGATPATAAAGNGIHRATFDRWMATDPTFRLAIDTARSACIANAITALTPAERRSYEKWLQLPLCSRSRGNRARIKPSVRAAVYARDGHACRRCGATDDLQVDHIIPVIHGGTEDLENLQTLCGPCNRHKGARLLAGSW